QPSALTVSPSRRANWWLILTAAIPCTSTVWMLTLPPVTPLLHRPNDWRSCAASWGGIDLMNPLFQLSIQAALLILVALIFPCVYRVWIGPSPADRLQAIDTITTLLIGIIIVLA